MGFVQSDMRGKHGKQPKLPESAKNDVRNFINSIPRTESHYLRADTQREYIEADKSLAELYRDYKSIQEDLSKPFVSSSMFNHIFNTEFNIGFFIPRKDQCDLCESYKNADDEAKEKMAEKYNEHLSEKKLSRQEKERDKSDKNIMTFVYDLQAVLPAPKGPASSFYYSSKMSCYNFTVSDLHAKK